MGSLPSVSLGSNQVLHLVYLRAFNHVNAACVREEISIKSTAERICIQYIIGRARVGEDQMG